MFGDDILVAPKLSLPYNVSQPSSIGNKTLLQAPYDKRYLVKVSLPESHGWYEYLTKRPVTEYRQEIHLKYDQCCGLFVRAGSVLPIKLHTGALSLERARSLPIRLEVYLDPASQSASGNLYLDDGDTFDYLLGVRALTHFLYEPAAQSWYEPNTHTLIMN